MNLAKSRNMFTTAMLRDVRFNGNGRISDAATSLAGGGSSDGALSVINAVDVCRRVGVGVQAKL
jgi:hypothetical protein